MPKLGVITCQILELEFAHVLSGDPDVSEIWVVTDEFSEELIRILGNGTQKPIHTVLSVNKFTPGRNDGVSVLVKVMGVGLHSKDTGPGTLALFEAAWENAKHAVK